MKPGHLRPALCSGVLAVVVAVLSADASAAPKPAAAADFEGRVVRVVDGATLVVRLADKSERTVRLRQIEVPEPCQPGAQASKQALVDLALGQIVQVQARAPAPGGADGDGVVAGVLLAGADLSRRQVEEGQAWSQRVRYDRGPLVKEERMATALKRGLHAQGAAETPQDFRRRHGPCR